jgi:DNA polymerase-3 subunit gamma/tau
MASSISNSTVFYRKWRPQLFKDVMGQEMLIKTLVQAIIQNRIGHAYLLTGPRGTGKTTTARILAKSINCLTNIPGESSSSAAEGEPCDKCESCESITNGTSMDLIEMDAASNRRIDDIRDLQERVFGAGPSISRSKVYIIDEVHMLTDQSFNALLKTLEEPAPWAHFVLCTTELHKVPATIISRCQKFNLTKIPIVHMENRLNFICNQEEITVQRDVLNAISSASSGSLRDACNMLEQIAIANNNTITKEIIDKAIGANLDPYSLSLVENLIERNIAGG